MEYKLYTIEILNNLGVSSLYKGYGYIVSSIEFIHNNKLDVLPITKVLYVEIAKKHNTSVICVEKDIRKTIDYIWSKDNKVRGEIFNTISKPTNKEFLLTLYFYIEKNKGKYMFMCPLSNKKCDYCKDVIYNFIENFIF